MFDIEETGKVVSGRKMFRVKETTEYCYSPKSTAYVQLVVIVPVGFESDCATIPWPLCLWLKPDGPWKDAAIVHDYLCRKGVSRFLADAVFRLVMEQQGVKLRVVLYYAVRIWWQIWGRWFSQKGAE